MFYSITDIYKIIRGGMNGSHDSPHYINLA